MRIVVDLNRCQAYAQCCFLASSVFQLHGEEALFYDPAPDEAQREQVLRAARRRVRCRLSSSKRQRRRTTSTPRSHVHSNGTGAAFKDSGRIVIVGASLAGLRAAETLRAEGFHGHLTLIGDEPYLPYDRPPLTKAVLTGWVPAEHTQLPRRATLTDVEWRLGVAATGLDRSAKQVRLADGQSVAFDRLLIATGTRARPWFNQAEGSLEGVFTLRRWEDAKLLHQRLAARPQRVLVIGGGFTGSEIASACCELGLPVTVVERGTAPLVGALGGVLADRVARLQVQLGVDLRCQVTVTSLEGDAEGRLRCAHLSDGRSLDTEVAVVALGAIRNTEWLHGSGLAVGAFGVGCDAGCRAFDINAIVTDDCVCRRRRGTLPASPL